ncbi:hypothetical protein BSZ39_10700 [Bowdeniella nasicola]|uniref:Putative 3-methyladenine DNA glycosylase n=1 Tax=Bowdeniella nasicola TaxID=208480 RepID=A0A1Q5Q019_9ACTO|nr:hypothetical protein BSZ39_10700 [Bowdeniella nasicola]
MYRASPSDLSGDPVELAPRLLGGIFRVDDVAVRLTEVEAYCGLADPGSHAYQRLTPRTQIMAGRPGHIYVYFSYGMHHAVNVVAHDDGEVGAILLRAGEIVDGIEMARARRIELRLARTSRSTRTSDSQYSPSIPDTHLTRGPGNLAAALGLTRTDDGAPLNHDDHAGLLAPDSLDSDTRPRRYELWLPTHPASPDAYVSTGRTGVSGEGGDPGRYPWRFALTGEPTVSPYRPAAPKTRPRS